MFINSNFDIINILYEDNLYLLAMYFLYIYSITCKIKFNKFVLFSMHFI